MTALQRKLLRDLRRNTGQYAAIVVVLAAGIAVAVAMFSTLASLQEARARYYTTAQFADLFASLRRAPRAVVDRVADIPGVQRAEGRIVYGVRVDVPDLPQPAFGSLVSLGENPRRSLNAVLLERGRYPAGLYAREAVVLQSFADANGIALGDTLSLVAGGRRIEVEVVGTGVSPEYILAAAPGDLIPDERRFAVLWMQRGVLGPLVDRDGAVNDVIADLAPGADIEAAINAVERELSPYGALDVIGREDQVSHAFLEGEIDQLQVLGWSFPPVFLGVAAYLLSVVMRRRIELERGQVGLLKAFGYSDWEVGAHYAMHGVVVALLGLLMGGLGGYQLSRMLNDLYADFYHFPAVPDLLSPGALAVVTVAALVASVLGVALALRHAVRLSPAVAMAPAAPEVFRRRFVDLRRLVDAPTAMVLRHLTRRPLRAILTLSGLAASMALLVSTMFFFDSVRALMDRAFFESQRWDVSVAFDEPLPERAFRWLQRREGVLRAEPQLDIRVRLSHGPRVERVALTGIAAGDELQQMIGGGGGALPVPVHGLVLSETLAGKLDAQVGDRVRVDVLDRARPSALLPVTALSSSYLGLTAHMGRADLRDLLGEDGIVSGAQLMVAADAVDALFNALRELPHIAGISTRADAVERFNEELIKSANAAMMVYIGFAGIVAFGVGYNAATITLSERARDLASLRVLGFTRAEAAYVLVGELVILMVLSLPFGAALGWLLSHYFGEALATDMYRFPVVVSTFTYAVAGLVVMVATAVSSLVAVKRVASLDLLETLKTRE